MCSLGGSWTTTKAMAASICALLAYQHHATLCTGLPSLALPRNATRPLYLFQNMFPSINEMLYRIWCVTPTVNMWVTRSWNVQLRYLWKWSLTWNHHMWSNHSRWCTLQMAANGKKWPRVFAKVNHLCASVGLCKKHFSTLLTKFSACAWSPCSPEAMFFRCIHIMHSSEAWLFHFRRKVVKQWRPNLRAQHLSKRTSSGSERLNPHNIVTYHNSTTVQANSPTECRVVWRISTRKYVRLKKLALQLPTDLAYVQVQLRQISSFAGTLWVEHLSISLPTNTNTHTLLPPRKFQNL